MMVLKYLIVSDGKVYLVNQENKIRAPPCSCVTLKEPSTSSVLQMCHSERIALNKIISKFNPDLRSIL